MNIQKEGLTQREAWDYCGGRGAFIDLQKAFPAVVKPYRETARCKLYMAESLRLAMRQALLLDQPLGGKEEA